MATIGLEKQDSAMQDELKKLHEVIQQLEGEAAKKDQQISQLTSRMREYEMGEYGLSEAVIELKDCHRVIRARDWEIEKLTDEINAMKLKVSDLIDKSSSKCSQLDNEMSGRPLEKTLSDEEKPVIKKKKFSKSIQCSMPTQPSVYVEEMCAFQAQNKLLRLQLKQVCEEALETSMYLQNINKQENLTSEKSLKCLKENVSKLQSNTPISNDLNIQHGAEEQLYEDFCEPLIKLKSGEDTDSEVYRDLMNQLRLSKSQHLFLIRRFIIVADREEATRKENLKLRKALNFYLRKNYSDQSYLKLREFSKGVSSKYLNSEEASFLKELSSLSQSKCYESKCNESINKLSGLIKKLLEELSILQQLLEIAHHQTQATEAVSFTQEVELASLKRQFSLFQAQSDEKLLLGKLSMKVLQLQFSQAASTYELKKCKSDKQAIEEWYSVIKKEYEENGKKFAGMYLDAQDKVKHLRDVLKDLCHRCNTALSSYLSPECK